MGNFIGFFFTCFSPLSSSSFFQPIKQKFVSNELSVTPIKFRIIINNDDISSFNRVKNC